MDTETQELRAIHTEECKKYLISSSGSTRSTWSNWPNWLSRKPSKFTVFLIDYSMKN